MRTILLVTCFCLLGAASTWSATVDLGSWTRLDAHDGYVIGNGRMYAVGALGAKLTRSGKSALTGEAVSLTRIAWLCGPHYTIGNLGYGWEIQPLIDGEPVTWQHEHIIVPHESLPFWGVSSEHPQITAQTTDVLIPGETVLLRRIQVSRPAGLPAARVQLRIPVLPDPRNAVYGMFDGTEVTEEVAKEYRGLCGKHLKPRASVPPENLQRLLPDSRSIVHLGASRALWQDISTAVPDDVTYETNFPPRAMATTVSGSNVSTEVMPGGFLVDLGEMRDGDTRTVGVWIATASGTQDSAQADAIQILGRWKARDVDTVVAESVRDLPEPVVRVLGEDSTGIAQIIQACAGLASATQSLAGGNMAQPYMYPMCYVRDQYGSFRFFLSLGDHERAYRILRFYVGMQNVEGIQNAHDGRIEPPDATSWDPSANARDGQHARAEVPSYIILMARDYLLQTNHIDFIRAIYPRLAYNLRVQAFNENHLLPYATDESYTNSPHTKPRFDEEMTDSNLLFIAAARFMTDLAERLDRPAEAEEFRRLHDHTLRAVMERLWLEDRQYFAYARQSDNLPEHVDDRPALDTLLRWTYLELGASGDPIAEGCYNAVMKHLVNPIRIVPEVYGFTAGMDPGYVLYAMARFQDPAMHAAAEMVASHASDTGLFSEFYAYENQVILPNGEKLRPWESSVCGRALLHYLLGLDINLAEGIIRMQPHLPPEWDGWETRPIELRGEGNIRIALKRERDILEFTCVRQGGKNPLTLHVEFGAYGPSPKPLGSNLAINPSRPDLLSASEFLAPTAEQGEPTRIVLRFKTQ